MAEEAAAREKELMQSARSGGATAAADDELQNQLRHILQDGEEPADDIARNDDVRLRGKGKKHRKVDKHAQSVDHTLDYEAKMSQPLLSNKKAAAAATDEDFAMDVSDARFERLLRGDDPDFGVDTTAAEFQKVRNTAGMRNILSEQQRRRLSANNSSTDAGKTDGKRSVDSMISKLKRKFGQAN